MSEVFLWIFVSVAASTTVDLPDIGAVERQPRQLNVIELAAQQRGTDLPETPNANA